MNQKEKNKTTCSLNAWRQFHNSICLLGEQKWRYILLLFLETLLNGLSPVISLIITQRMLNALQMSLEDFQPIMLYVGFLFVFTICMRVLQNSFSYWKEREEFLFEKNFHTLLLRKVDAMDCSDLENNDYYDLIDRTQYDANAGILGNIKNTFSFLTALIGTISYILILADYNFLLLAVIILVPLIRYFFEKKYNLLSYQVMRENTEKERRMAYYFRMLIDADSAKEIRMYQLSGLFTGRYARLKEFCNRKTLDISKKRMRILSVLEIIENILDCICVLYLATETFHGNLLLGSFILYSNSIDSAKQSLLNFFLMRSVLYKYASMLEQIQAFLKLPEEQCNTGGETIGEIHTLEVKHLSYHYPNRKEMALQDVSFILRAGELTVLMGYNGSGKSTLVKILMGIYHNYEGDILVNGINRRLLDLNQYRKKISVVFQNYIKFETSISENIWYGNPLREPRKEAVAHLLKSSGLEEFLEEQDAALGYQFCNGRQISLGQWQKLAVGRGLFRKSDVYILDEPNASLDLLSEEAIFQNIEKEAAGQIRLLIMHRFNHFAIGANQILVLDRGRIAEHGKHHELMKLKGLYYRLYCAQNGS